MAHEGMETPSAQAIPSSLSKFTEKRILYSSDTYFRESLEDLVEASEGAIDQFCQGHGLMLLKPDAVVTRRLGCVLRWVSENGFSVAGSARVTMNRHAIRALWQYGLNAASRDRIDAADLYVTAGDCLLLLLAHKDGNEPATLVLSRAKGPADPADCRPGQLRYEIGSFNYQLNLVHTADEPADLIRELGVLCDHKMRMRLFRQALASADFSAEAYEFARQLENAAPENDLDFDRTIAALAAALERPGSTTAAHLRAELACLLSAAREGRSRDWRQILRLADSCGVPVGLWQRIVIATHLLDPYEPGRTSHLPDVSAGGREPGIGR